MALETLAADERRAHIIDLFEQGSAAHAQYESIILKRPDPNWPKWLAGFALDRGLGKWLSAAIGEDQLAALLRRFDADHKAGAQEQTRFAYIAERLLAEVK